MAELHSRQMQVSNLAALANERVRVTLSEVQNPGGGPGVAVPSPGSFGWDCDKGDEPALYDVVDVTVASTA